MDDFFKMLQFEKLQKADQRYIPYQNSRLYLKQKYDRIPKNIKGTWPSDYKKWAARLGYTHANNMCSIIPRWLNLQTEIPYKLLDYMSIEMKDLTEIFNLDLDAYETALKNCHVPEGFQIRLFACVYPYYKFPEGLTEDEAIQYVQNTINEYPPTKKISGLINFGRVKHVFIKREEHRTYNFRPMMILGKLGVRYKNYLNAGTVSIG